MKRILIVCGAIGLLLVLMTAAVQLAYHRGLTAGVAQEQAAHTQALLDANARYQRSLDSANAVAIRRIAIADSLAGVARARATAARAREDSARKRISILSDSLVSIDSQPPAPADPVLITALRRADERRELDSLAIVGLERQVRERDNRLRVLKLSNDVWKQRDSLNAVATDRLRAEAQQAGKRGFWKGVKVGAGAAVGILAALAIVLEE